MTEPLRPLLRPLPSAAQSPAYVLHGSIPPFMSSNPTPTSAFPRPPAPTPIRSAIPTLMIPRESNQVFEMIPPTPSPLFPRDLKSLFSLGPDAARRLLRDYGIEGDTDAVRSPRTDEPRPKAAPKNTLGVVSESPSEPLSPTSADSESRENDINKFMAHIGVRAYTISLEEQKQSSKLQICFSGPLPHGSSSKIPNRARAPAASRCYSSRRTNTHRHL